MTTKHKTNETIEALKYANDSYLDYSMYVIMSRALPFIGDGLKPVQRRIIYAMSELSLDHKAKYKKAARTVGDVLGKYHPHGDSACYESMVLMAQPFSFLHPMVDGQGNWGAIDDPKSFAAMRYTEARLSAFADDMVAEIKQDTVEWAPNFDGTLKEPTTLPARLPNILLNDTTGIAVGISCDIPSHNLEEVVNACVAVLKKKSTTDDEILDMIPYPDYPTGGEIITPLDKIRDAYRTGQGSFKIRGNTEIKGKVITITSIPPTKQLPPLLEAINGLIQKDKLPITDIRDLSDANNPICVEIEVKSAERARAVLDHLFTKTALEITLKINMNMIGLNQRPEQKPLPVIIREWCEFRQNVFERKKRFRLRAIESRIHILDGLLTAYNNLDEVIRIIRESDDAKSDLMRSFGLTELQVKAILDLRLRQLAKLEQSALELEKSELEGERDKLVELLADDGKIRRAIIAELKESCKLHRKDRVTTHCVRTTTSEAAVNLNMVEKENATVIISSNHWLRSMKGHGVDVSSLSFKTGDSYAQHIETDTLSPLIMMGTQGRFFAIPVHQLPNGKSTGEPVTSKVTLENGEKILCGLPYNEEAKVLITTSKGNGFIVPMKNLDTRAKRGKQVLVLTDGDAALTPEVLSPDHTSLVILTAHGRMVIIPIDEINESNKSQGVRLVDIKANEFLAETNGDKVEAVLPLANDETFNVYVGKRKFVIDGEKQSKYRAKRARRGLFFEGGRNNLSISKT
ncbi:MAG: DNA topoisomerase IV subunit A [Planctomycetes bacterium]|nr:DNA topoisomerase IV subunit A [Planctomycetota bacterium]